jgi:hypothetical protein
MRRDHRDEHLTDGTDEALRMVLETHLRLELPNLVCFFNYFFVPFYLLVDYLLLDFFLDGNE